MAFSRVDDVGAHAPGGRMKRNALARAMPWLGMLASVIAASAQQDPMAEIEGIAKAAADTSKLTCRTDSAQPEPELAKSRAALKARYPELPWAKIESVAEAIGSTDLAIVLGTNCQDYVFSTKLRALAATTLAARACSVYAEKDVASCLKEIACANVGRYSRACGAKFSWER